MGTENINQTTTTTTNLPDWIQPYYDKLADASQVEALKGYQEYGGPRIQGYGGFVSPEQAAQSPEMAAQMGYQQMGLGSGPWQQEQGSQALQSGLGQMQGQLNQAGGYGQQDYGNISGVAGQYMGMGLGGAGKAAATGQQYADQFGGIGTQFQNIDTGAQSQLDADMGAYANPYTQQVTDIAARQAMDFGKQQKSELGGQAGAAGAFGGYRHGLQESNIDKGVRQEVSDIRTRGLESAFNQATSAFQGDRAAGQMANTQRMQALQGGLGAVGQGLGAQQYGQGFGQKALGAQASTMGQASQLRNQGFQNMMSGIGQYGSMGQGLAGLGEQEQQMAQSRLAQMEASGTRNRALRQAGLDQGYQDFRNEQDWGKNQQSWFSSILGGFNPGQVRQEQQMSQQPGLFQGMLGTGIAGLGLYNQVQGRG